MRAVRLFLRARTVIKFVLQAVSTLEKTRWREASTFSANRNLSFIKRKRFAPGIWLTPPNQENTEV